MEASATLTPEDEYSQPISVNEFFNKILIEKMRAAGHSSIFIRSPRITDILTVILKNKGPIKPEAIYEELKDKHYFKGVKNEKDKAGIIRRDLRHLIIASVLERLKGARYRIRYNVMGFGEKDITEKLPEPPEPFKPIVKLRHELEDYGWILKFYRHKSLCLGIMDVAKSLKKIIQSIEPSTDERDLGILSEFKEAVGEFESRIQEYYSDAARLPNLEFYLDKIDQHLGKVYNVRFKTF